MKDKLIRIDKDLISDIIDIAKKEDRTIPRQVNRWLKISIDNYKRMHKNEIRQ